MTVCTASIFNWRYSESEFGGAIVLASDRMYSDNTLGIEYQSSRKKVANITPRHMIMVAGDISINSRAILSLLRWRSDNESLNTAEIAVQFSRIVSTLAFESAAKTILNPLGIFTDEVIEDERGLQRYGLPDALALRVAEQLQYETLDVEAIVAGCDGKLASIYRIDGKGRVSLHSDIGFVSIGSGGIHSSAYFMQMPYDHTTTLHSAMVSTFFAKKRAEIAPGVGPMTDMSVINASGAFDIQPAEMRMLEKSYVDKRRRDEKTIKSLEKRFSQNLQKKHQPQ